jgi:hypothetical protein
MHVLSLQRNAKVQTAVKQRTKLQLVHFSYKVYWLEAIPQEMFTISTEPFQAVLPNFTIQLRQVISRRMCFTMTTSVQTVSML